MTNFPSIESISVDKFGLYPGSADKPGLDANLAEGLSVIVGANGLGKSTLLTIAYRLLTGPWDIPGAARDGELGSANLAVKRISANESHEFGHRVSDAARSATATITFALADQRFSVTRSLFDLKLTSWYADGVEQASVESSLQSTLANACGVWSFSDWILVLRYVTFYMDDRQVLFWDRSAQKQLLRSLFLSPSEAQQWAEMERDVLQLDSRFRNFRNVFNQESARLTSQIDPSSDANVDLRLELTGLLGQEAEEVERLENSIREVSNLDERRANRNLERLRARQRLDEYTRAYEHAKLVLLSSRFPTSAESALFIWNQILSDSHCLLCGNEVPQMRDAIESRLANQRCAVCDSQLEPSVAGEETEQAVELSRVRSTRAWDDLLQQRALVTDLETSLDAMNTELAALRESIAEVEVARTVREQRIGALRAQLPADVDGYFTDRSNLASMKIRLESMGEELRISAERFESFIAEKSKAILDSADSIKSSFERYARLFLLGDGELSWTPREDQIGQSPYKVTFPAYELQLGRNDTGSISTRSGIADVSESQKEFIDLAFRMALIETAGSGQGASLLIDTPESSLDAVFSDRAASVLADFASKAENRLVIASNLPDGKLVPMLIRAVRNQGFNWNLINLFDIARPTLAIRELGAEYKRAYDKLLSDVDAQ